MSDRHKKKSVGTNTPTWSKHVEYRYYMQCTCFSGIHALTALLSAACKHQSQHHPNQGTVSQAISAHVEQNLIRLVRSWIEDVALACGSRDKEIKMHKLTQSCHYCTTKDMEFCLAAMLPGTTSICLGPGPMRPQQITYSKCNPRIMIRYRSSAKVL